MRVGTANRHGYHGSTYVAVFLGEYTTSNSGPSQKQPFEWTGTRGDPSVLQESWPRRLHCWARPLGVYRMNQGKAEIPYFWIKSVSGWWFGTCFMNFIFHNKWVNPSHWLIFFKMVKTTNQFKTFQWISRHFCTIFKHYLDDREETPWHSGTLSLVLRNEVGKKQGQFTEGSVDIQSFAESRHVGLVFLESSATCSFDLLISGKRGTLWKAMDSVLPGLQICDCWMLLTCWFASSHDMEAGAKIH